jgi:hypothetical protein
MTPIPAIEHAKLRYGFRDWPPGPDAVVRNFVPSFEAHPAKLRRYSQTPYPMSCAYHEEHRSADDPLQRLHVFIAHEHSSAAARESLLHWLSECTAPKLPEGNHLGIGERAYIGNEEQLSLIVFVRHGILVDLCSAGDHWMDVEKAARLVDDQILARVR